MTNKYIFCSLLILVLHISACKNSAFLDRKPDMGLVIPHTLNDLQALLDNDWVMNGGPEGGQGIQPSLGEAFADDYYVLDENFDFLSEFSYKLYTWNNPLTNESTEILDWALPYKAIFYSNVVLDGLEKISPANDPQKWEQLRGTALFYRSFMLFNIVGVFAPFYQANRAENDLGIPLRLQADINEPLPRATLKQTYDQVINDLAEAYQLLPEQVGYPTRPTKKAVLALLARIYLSMADYEKALFYSQECMAVHPFLLNYNEVDSMLTFPFSRFNQEVIYHSTLITSNTMRNEFVVSYGLSLADNFLLSTYRDKDLRKKLYFNRIDDPAFNGSYTGSRAIFSGLATDEVILIQAECLARLGRTEKALQQLNTLLVNRYEKDQFVPYASMTPEEALQLILDERRKELHMRGVRWSDLRRLNQEPRFAKTLSRKVKGKTFTLVPNDPRYVFPIPEKVINLNPQIENDDN